MPKRDYYRVLRVTPLTYADKIKETYKELVREWHPDVNPDNRALAEKKMQQLTEAFKVISNREERKLYDSGPPFRPKIPKYLDKGSKAAGKIIRPHRRRKKTFWDKCKDLMFVKDPEEEEKKRIEFEKKLTKQGYDSFVMGVSCLKKKQENMLGLAKAEFESIIKESPENPDVAFNLALVKYKFGEYEEAVKYLKKAQEHYPKDPDVKKFLELLRDPDEI